MIILHFHYLTLGFVIHPSKSVFLPFQKITYLSFVLDSVEKENFPDSGKSRET